MLVFLPNYPYGITTARHRGGRFGHDDDGQGGDRRVTGSKPRGAGLAGRRTIPARSDRSRVQAVSVALMVGALIAAVPAPAQTLGDAQGPWVQFAQVIPPLIPPPLVPEELQTGETVTQTDTANNLRIRAPRSSWKLNDLKEAMFVGCVGGAWLTGVTAASTAAVARSRPQIAIMLEAFTGLALPNAATAIVSAAGVGCLLGVSAALVTTGASLFWRQADW